jgi:sugar phosphate isomerase/epimerase
MQFDAIARGNSRKWPLGLFVRAGHGLKAALDDALALGITTVHLLAPPASGRTRRAADDIRRSLSDHGLRATCLFANFDGERYADIPSVRMTVGLAPPATRQLRLCELQSTAEIARELGIDAVGLHIGFVPHDTADREHHPLVEATREACETCASLGQTLHLETGQEPAEVLLRFITDVDCPNIYVNFDPANMILYGVGEPIAALRQLGQRVRSVHCKDALWSERPGETWGREVPLGDGDVDIHAFLSALAEIGYDGPLTIERESGVQPGQLRAELSRSVKLLNQLCRGLD